MALLELVDVSKSFGGVKAVERFSLTVEKGELVGLIGPNGAGKTTVFNIITGLYPSEGGQILFQGEDIAPLKPHEIVPKGIARTFQNLRLFARSSALENVMTAYRKGVYSFMEALCHMGRWKKTEEEAKARGMELLDLVGIADRADQAAGTLPYGHQRRVEMARALALEARASAVGRARRGDERRRGRRAECHDKEDHRRIGYNYRSNRAPYGARYGDMSSHHMYELQGEDSGRIPARDPKPPWGARRLLGRRFNMTSPPRPILSVRDLYVSHGAIKALHGVSMDVYEGNSLCHRSQRRWQIHAPQRCNGDGPSGIGRNILRGQAVGEKATRL